VAVVDGVGGRLSGVRSISASGNHTCAVMADTTVKCWGGNGSGQLGDGTTTSSPVPVVVGDGSGSPLMGIMAVAAGGGASSTLADAHTCALLADVTLRCWGANGYGQLGIGAAGLDVSTPTAVNGLSGATAIAAGVGYHVCARLLDGSAACWGYNTAGQLGDGTTSGSPAPVATLPLGVTWTSSDSAVAAIDTNGIATAGHEGTAIISAAYGSLSGDTTVSVFIPLNQPPTAGADTATITEDAAPVTIAVLVNDTDPDGDALTIVGVTTPQHGSAVTDGSTMTYTPDPNYYGSDSFDYTISDGHAHTAIGTVLVSIAGVPDAPFARNDFYTISQNTGAVSVLANDIELDGRTMTAVLVSPPATGSVSLNANGTFTYTPTSPVSGPDSFTYKVFDGLLDSNTATVSVNNSCSINWKNAASGLWSDAANWEPGRLPVSADDVCIGADGVYSVVLQGMQSAANVTIGSSSLGVGPTLRLEATDTTPANLTLTGNMSNAGAVLLDSVGVQDAALMLTSGVLNNQPTGVVNVNAGAGGARTISGSLMNQGTVHVAAATIWTGGDLTNISSVTLSERLTTNGATFTQRAGTLNVVGDWSVVGDRFVMNAGVFNFTGGTVSGTVSLRNSRLNSTPTIGSGRFFMSGPSVVTGRILAGQQVVALAGTGNTDLAIAADTNAGVLGLSSAFEDGNATLRIVSSALTNTGTLLVEQGPRSGARTLAGIIDNRMTVNIATDTAFSGGAITNHNSVTISGRLTMDGSSFNQYAGTLELVGDWSLVGYRFVMTSGAFNFGGGLFNGGTVSGRLSLHDSVLNSRPSLGSGQFDLSGTSTLTGRIRAGQQVMGQASAGGTILTAAGLTNEGLLSLSSASENGDATLAITFPLVNTGTLLVEQGPKTGVRTIDGGLLVNQGSVSVTTNATVNNGDLTNEGSVTLNGRLTMNGTTFNQSGGTLILNGAPSVFGNRFVMNGGTFNFTGGTISGSDYVQLQNSTLNSNPTSGSGEFRLSGASTLRGTILDGQRVQAADTLTATGGVTNHGLLLLGRATLAIDSAAFTNRGELVVFGGSAISGDITNTRSVLIAGGTLLFDAGTFRNVAPGTISTNNNNGTFAIGSAGVFFGNGSILANVVNAGQFNPGLSPGSVTITGNYTQNGGVHIAEIGGPSPGVDYDVMTVSGTVTIDPSAALQVIRLGGYCPSSSSRIINAGALIGDFGTKTVNPAGGTLSTSIGAATYDVAVDCRLPQTITFAPPPGTTFGDPPFTVAATASSGLPVSFTTTGTCTNAGATVTITGAGSCTITASQGGNAAYQAAPDVQHVVSIARARATLILSGLSQIYDGTPRVVGWRTIPAGLTVVSVTYDGSPTPPVNAGRYDVVATLNNPNYLAASPTGTLVVDQAPTSTVVTSSLNPSPSGVAVSFVAVVTAPGGGTPTGTVAFKDGGVEFGKPNPIGRKTLGPCPAPAAPNTACATYRISTLSKGKHSITADYFGDVNLTPSSSPVLTQQVKR
jgi:hypothetical protein